MPKQSVKTVPNQRMIEVNKAPTDKAHLFTQNNLAALDEAAGILKSVGGFKLYIYLAKNQDKYTFALSRADFMRWSGLGDKAYTTGFNELVEKGYLIQSKKQSNLYAFFDKQQQQKDDTITIVYPATIDNGFTF